MTQLKFLVFINRGGTDWSILMIFFVLVLIVILFLFLILKGPSQRGRWEQDRLYNGVLEFIDWQTTLFFIMFSASDSGKEEDQRFIARCVKQVLFDIQNNTLYSDYITHYIAGAALKGSYILGGPSHMGARILASTTVRKIMGVDIAQSINAFQNGFESQHSQAVMEGLASFAAFFEWKRTGVQNKHFSSGLIIDHFLEDHPEYMTRVLSDCSSP